MKPRRMILASGGEGFLVISTWATARPGPRLGSAMTFLNVLLAAAGNVVARAGAMARLTSALYMLLRRTLD
jgi:hypothetical protein